METRIRERVKELLDSREDVRQADFGVAIGRGYSWVSAFLSGARNANDILLLTRIARFFGVSVGYLIGESDRKLNPSAATLLATFDDLTERDRALLLKIAASFRTPNGSEPPAPADGDGGGPGRKGPKHGEPPRPKRR